MLLAALAGAILAWLGYMGRLREPLARLAAFSRFVAAFTLLLLLLDPGFLSRTLGSRPLVLLDRSLSMSATGGRGAEAIALASTLGDTTSFGLLSPSLAGGSSHLADMIAASVAAGRQVVVVSDGEIPDASAISPDILTTISVHTLPRPPAPDIAITQVRAAERLSSGDSLFMEIQGHRNALAPDTATVEVRDSNTVLMKGIIRFKSASDSRITLATKLASNYRGDHWLEIRLAGKDSEAADDIRWWHIAVAATPGIIVLSSTPDWDGRALFRTLKQVSDAPVSGYVQLQTGHWYRMTDLHPVTVVEVSAAAKAADLLAVRGDIAPWRNSGHARLLWAPADDEGDWFVTARTNSPVGSAFLGVDDDSLPPAVSANSIQTDIGSGWVGMTARRSRRGAEVPIVGGREDNGGRTIWFGADGLYRWAGREGSSGQTWRSLIAASANWLLTQQQGDSILLRPVSTVTQQGMPVQFQWLSNAPPTPQPVHLESSLGSRIDTLRFDGSGRALLTLTMGRYHYRVEHGGSGAFAVEPYSDEFVPAAVTMHDQAAAGNATAPRRSWRELWWLFAICVAGFGIEWLVRRRMGAL